MRLRQLLQQVPLPSRLLDPSPQQPAAGRQSEAPTAGAVACSSVLQLPDNVLHRIARLAGKQCRVVCSHLREIYGCPEPVLRQPSTGFGLALANQFYRDGYLVDLDAILTKTLEQALIQHGSKFTLAAFYSCAARWPRWAGQVTQLQLSDTCKPSGPMMQSIHTALPGLRELSIAEAPSRGPVLGPLPQFPELTHLGMLCSSYHLSNYCGEASVRFELLSVAPSLRSLHLDLRFHRLRDQLLQRALQPLVQLTHLELVFGPGEFNDDEGDLTVVEEDRAEVHQALLSLACRLQSLVFLTPAGLLEPGLLTVLQSLTCLTSLGWCTHWGLEFGGLQATHSCLLLPGLRQLVVGTASCGYRGDQVALNDARKLADVFARASAGGAAPWLRTLVLPVVVLHRREDVQPDGTESLHRLLTVVADRCPELTSLRLGFTFEDGSENLSYDLTLPRMGPWLPPVARLQQLQRLMVTMNAEDVDSLECLGRLPLLSELWLRLKNEFLLVRRVEEDPAYRPGAVLASLTSLRHLSLRTSCDAAKCPELVQGLLEAAGSLPWLRLLDLSAVTSLEVLHDALLPLAASPPPSLCEVRLCSRRDVCSWERAMHERTLAMLKARLPERVAVTVSSATLGEGDSRWGPGPCTLAEMSVQHAW